MVFGEVLEEQPQLAQVGHVHEVGVVEDGGQGFAGVVAAEGLFDEPAFALECGAFEFDAEGVAEDFDGVGIGVQRASDGGDQVLVFGEALQGLLEDGLAGAGNAEHQAEPALLAMDFEEESSHGMLEGGDRAVHVGEGGLEMGKDLRAG